MAHTDETFASAGADDPSVKDELLGLEKRYWKAIQRQRFRGRAGFDGRALHCDRRSGRGQPRSRSFPRTHESANFKIEDVYFDPDVQIRMLGSDAAVLAYTVRERLTVDGKSITMDAADASTWVRRNGQWKCALHTESIKGDPFGRDRATA